MSEALGPPPCPWCESADVVPIEYGFPPFWRRDPPRKAVWGGCIVDGREPRWHCLRCSREWGRPYEEGPSYCERCGRPSRYSWCSACNERANEDAERILAEAFRGDPHDEEVDGRPGPS